jgi:hypothetical protein
MLYKFQDARDGGLPSAGLAIDSAGHIYGTASAGGDGMCMSTMYIGCGTVFEFQGSNPHTLYSFPGNYMYGFPFGPQAPVAVDAAGNLYGTSFADGFTGAGGNVFKLTPVGNSWTFTPLIDFSTTNAGKPISNVIFDSSGNLYGTASQGGSGYGGVVWEITP